MARSCVRLRKCPKVFMLLVLFVSVLYIVGGRLYGYSRLSLSKPEKAGKWIIIEMRNMSSESAILEVPGWRLLILGKYNISCNNCLHYTKQPSGKMLQLFPDLQKRDLIRMESIKHMLDSGAEWIYCSNGIHDLLKEADRFKLDPQQTGIIYRSDGVMDPYNHFTRHKEQAHYQLTNWLPIPAVQKIWRPEMLEKSLKTVTEVDYHAPPVLVPSFTFHMEILDNSLFHRNLSWSLAPLLTAPKDSLSVWSFWIQRLMWEFGGNTAVLTPLQKSQYVSSENIVDRRFAQLIKKLTAWKCSKNKTFEICVNDLADSMEHWGYFTRKEISTIKNWLSVLQINLPSRIYDIKKAVKIKAKKPNRVIFNPRGKVPTHSLKMSNPFRPVCNSTKSEVLTTSSPAPIEDILLIIIFNKSHYLENFEFLLYMYGRHFSHILICADYMDDFIQYKSITNMVSFLEMNVRNSDFGYECTIKAMQMGYEVSGYLQMNDDVLLNVWNVAHLPRDQIWFQNKLREADVLKSVVSSFTQKHEYWTGWLIPSGRQSIYKLWQTFTNISDDPNADIRILMFKDTLNFNTGSSTVIYYEASDIYYIPRRLKDIYVFISTIFLQYRVSREIAIPTIINGLVPQEEIIPMSGSYLRNKEKKIFYQKFNSSHIFLHPFQLSETFSTHNGLKLICETVLPKIDQHLRQFYFGNGSTQIILE